jgi:hypothetical protein
LSCTIDSLSLASGLDAACQLFSLVADMASAESQQVARTGLARAVVASQIRIREACKLEAMVIRTPPT